MGKFGAILHTLGVGKGKYRKYQGTFTVDKPFDYLTEQFEMRALKLQWAGRRWENATRVDENTHLFTIIYPLEEQKQSNKYDPDNLVPADEICFHKVSESKTEVSMLVYDVKTYDADYKFEEAKNWISKLQNNTVLTATQKPLKTADFA